MIKTYTYKLLPNERVLRRYFEWCGICRYVYNVAKETKEDSYKKGVSVSYYDLSKQLTEAKVDFPFLRTVNAQTLQGVLERLDKGYQKFFSDLKRGVKTNKPKWASKNKWKSIPFKSIKAAEGHFVLPNFGKVRVFKFKHPKGELRTASLVKEADGLYLKVVVNEPSIERERESQSIVAVDMGLKYFLTTSDAEYVSNPKHLFKKLAKLRIQQRKLSRMKKGGANWKKQVNVVQRLHQKVRRTRLDFLHKESTKLSNLYDYVVVEDLNIRGMSKNSRLAKHILDCSWGTFFDLLSYKTHVIKVDPKYSSQECSKCGDTRKENRVTQSLFECQGCGHTDNADLDAAKVLLSRGRSALGANVGGYAERSPSVPVRGVRQPREDGVNSGIEIFDK